MEIDTLLAVSPIDGRYSGKCAEFREVFSEHGLRKRRVLVECAWLKALSAEPNIRVDTHSDNHIMQHLLARHGFTLCGTIYLASGSPRLAYQRLLPTATQPAK